MSKGLLAVILFSLTYAFAAVAKPALTKKQHDALLKKAKQTSAAKPRSTCSDVRIHVRSRCKKVKK